MKKLWIFLSLLICSTLIAGCNKVWVETPKNIDEDNTLQMCETEKKLKSENDFISDCKSLIQNEFWDTEYVFSWDINFHSGVYFNYSMVTGSVTFDYKTRPFLCLYEWNRSVVDIVDFVKKDDTKIDLAYLQSFYDELSQEDWDNQWTTAKSIFDLVASHKEFKEKYWNKDVIGWQNAIRNIVFENWVTEEDLKDSDNYYNQVFDIWRQKYNQIPFYQREYFVQLMNKLLSEKWISAYCSASICDEMTFSWNYGSQENLHNLVNDLTSIITALHAYWVVFNWDFETLFGINVYDDEYIRKIDTEIIKKPNGTPNIEKLDDVVAICHNNSINCEMDCEDWNITNKSYILPYKDWYIGYNYGWNGEWRGYYLTYKTFDDPCESAISTTDEIFFWHTRYAHYKETFGYDEYPDDRVYVSEWLWGWWRTDEVAKVLDCVAWKDMMEDDTCKREVDKYMYNLIVWNEKNEYFTKWMNKFKQDLDNNKFTPASFRAGRWNECNERYKFEDLLQKDWKINSQLTDEERQYYIKLQNDNLHACALEYLNN